MKHQIIILFALFATTIFSQNYSGNFTFRDTLYSVKSEKQETGAFTITIEESSGNKSDFTLNPLKLETFDVAFKSKLKLLLPAGRTAITSEEELELSGHAKNQFYNIVAESLKENLSDAPVSGKLTIAKKVTMKDVNGNFDQKKDAKPEEITINDVEIEFQEGYIETIKVNGVSTDGSKIYRFENQFGIGFSARSNFNKLGDISLFDFKNKKSITIGDLLDYDYKVKSSTRDFSPGNQTIYSYGGEKLQLHKDITSKLLEAIVYSDFIGVDKDKPNGLVQTEINKRINISPVRMQAVWWLRWGIKGYGIFQYIKPSITISKIEENNRRLLPQTNDLISKNVAGQDSNLTSRIFTTPLKILNYQNASIGFDLNFLFLDNPSMKYNLYINGGFRYARTSIRDSIREIGVQGKVEKNGLVNDFGINYFTYYPEVVLHFLPEERFSFSISNKWQYLVSGFSDPQLVSYGKNGQLEEKVTKWINTFEIMAYFKTGDKGKFFARLRYHHQLGNIKENFHQIQAGYSFYVLKSNK